MPKQQENARKHPFTSYALVRAPAISLLVNRNLTGIANKPSDAAEPEDPSTKYWSTEQAGTSCAAALGTVTRCKCSTEEFSLHLLTRCFSHAVVPAWHSYAGSQAACKQLSIGENTSFSLLDGRSWPSDLHTTPARLGSRCRVLWFRGSFFGTWLACTC